MLEVLPAYALVEKPKNPIVNGKVSVINSTDTQFGDRHYYNGPVTFVCPKGVDDSELTLKPGLLETTVARAIGNHQEEKTDNNKKVSIANKQKFKFRRLHLLTGSSILVAIATIATLAVIFGIPGPIDDDNDLDDLNNEPLKIIKRGEWFALPAKGQMDKLKIQPVPYIILGEAVSSMCRTIETCSNVMRQIQLEHTNNRKFSDIGYNFVIGYDGNAYEGRGWDISGAHTKYYNSISMGINFIGFYEYVVPSKRILSTFWKLVQFGIDNKKIAENYTIFTHRQIKNSSSPGQAFYKLIQTWPQWKIFNESSFIS